MHGLIATFLNTKHHPGFANEIFFPVMVYFLILGARKEEIPHPRDS